MIDLTEDRTLSATFIKKKWPVLFLHVLIWLMVFLIPYFFSANLQEGHHVDEGDNKDFLYVNTGINFFWLALFYFNTNVLLPTLVYKRKIGLYILTLAGCFFMVILADNFFFNLFVTVRRFSLPNSIKHNFLPFVFTLAVGAGYKAISDKAKTDMLVREKQSENLKTELSFLRSQISPHFLFNVLNNIVALIRTKSNELEPTVLKLSSLMQYMLYETDEEKVVLKSEVEYLQNYIDLQKQRFGPELGLKTCFEILEDWHVIEPMLLIPFVENAFKHGNSLMHDPEMDIQLTVKNNSLHFVVKNRFEETGAIKDKTSGIGLQNVQRRLQLLYPQRHTLTTHKSDGWFTIHLYLMLT